MKKITVRHLRSAAAFLLALSLSVAVAFPVFYALCAAFKTEREFIDRPGALLPLSFANLRNFETVFRRVPIGRFFVNSLVSSLMGTALRMACAALAACAFAFYSFKGRKLTLFVLMCTMMFPADTLLVTNYRTVAGMGLVDTYLGMVVVSLTGASQMLMLFAAFRQVPPSLRDAALLDGCGDLRFMVSVLFPVRRGLIMTLSVQAFVNFWNSYLWPLIVTNDVSMRTLQVGIAMLTTVDGSNYHEILAGAVLSLLPAFVLFYLLRRSVGFTDPLEGINE